MQEKQHDIQDIFLYIKDTKKVLNDPYIDDDMRAYYTSELEYWESFLPKKRTLTVPLF